MLLFHDILIKLPDKILWKNTLYQSNAKFNNFPIFMLFFTKKIGSCCKILDFHIEIYQILNFSINPNEILSIHSVKFDIIGGMKKKWFEMGRG